MNLSRNEALKSATKWSSKQANHGWKYVHTITGANMCSERGYRHYACFSLGRLNHDYPSTYECGSLSIILLVQMDGCTHQQRYLVLSFMFRHLWDVYQRRRVLNHSHAAMGHGWNIWCVHFYAVNFCWLHFMIPVTVAGNIHPLLDEGPDKKQGWCIPSMGDPATHQPSTNINHLHPFTINHY